MNLHLLPLAGVYLLGAWVLWPLGWPFSLGYGLYAVGSNLVFIATICPRCGSFGSARCESGYGTLSARLVRRGSTADFPAYFRRYIPLVAAGWALPVLGGLVILYRSLGDARDLFFAVAPLVVFSVVAFGVLPKSSKESCARCPQRRNCPGTRFTVGERGGGR